MSLARDALWASGHDESVEVNQRALIDKVLARYSGEFTVFRELLQNSDDASAKAVEIHFDTEAFVKRNSAENSSSEAGPSAISEKLPDLKTSVVHQWTFKNDGIIFRDEDWNRLKKIAEGNPDEEKIGAFGVGQWMGFYWKDKKDQLFARRGNIPPEESSEPDKWTTFTMPLREPGPAPTPFDFVRFLASSITFMNHLSEVSVFFDGRRLARLHKERGVPRPLALKPTLKRETPKGTMRVSGVSVMPLSIKAEIMQWVYVSGSATKRRMLPKVVQETRKAVTSGFFSSLFSSFAANTPQRPSTPIPDPKAVEAATEEEEAKEQQKLLQINETSVVLAVFAADVDVNLDDRMKRELLRATKKNAPHKMRYELIYTGKDEYDASRKEDEQYPHATGSVFQGLRADMDGTGTGRVFIGHSTGQTTGIGGHMAARFIPTVERESIDLVDRNVRIWNEELLGVGGYLAHTAYEKEMDSIAELWPAQDESSDEVRSHLRARALHALKFFTFHASTPSAQVASVMEESFFSCAVAPQSAFNMFMAAPKINQFPVMSSVGVRNIADIRMPNPTFGEFLKNMPVLTQDFIDGAKPMVEALKARGMIKEITFQDVLGELRSRPLNETELVACFKWWINLYKVSTDGQIPRYRSELLDAAVLMMPNGESEKVIPLSSIQSFLNPRTIGSFIPVDGPLPAHLLPISVNRHFDPQSLIAAFGWREFGIAEWIRYILDPEVASSNIEFDITSSPPWAERVLNVLTRAWPSCGPRAQKEIVELMKDKVCIPTSAGLKTPGDAYFQNVNVFPDLPLVTLPSGTAVKGPLEKVLQSLGVRKHVELQLVFNRMIKTGDWSIADLIKYLVAVQSTLSADEIERLCITPAFPKENKEVVANGDTAKITRFKAGDLYEPLDVFRDLGLPVLDWGTKTKWRPSSEEAKFLFRLGLRRFPPLETIVQLAGGPDARIRGLALKYFLDNHANRRNIWRNPER
ncbi:hypothetical protein EIP86_003262 [Pleurotus ostreatoroseus]|nr:hypothetical protein EIP86_003262 [Pleurotus ostreatoroseus]